jgi:hypothetical protein
MNRIRHSGIFNCSNTGVTIIGLGGIGAITAITLAKMGVGYLTLADGDTVGEENLATQLYPLARLAWPKATATREAIKEYSDDVAVSYFIGQVVNDRNVDWEDIANEIIVSAVDSIASRKEIWAKIAIEPWQWYLDARMGAENLLIYIVDGRELRNRVWYGALLDEQSDEQALEEPCTSKATFFCAAGAACLLGKTVRQIVTLQKPPRVISWDILSDRMVTI